MGTATSKLRSPLPGLPLLHSRKGVRRPLEYTRSGGSSALHRAVRVQRSNHGDMDTYRGTEAPTSTAAERLAVLAPERPDAVPADIETADLADLDGFGDYEETILRSVN